MSSKPEAVAEQSHLGRCDKVEHSIADEFVIRRGLTSARNSALNELDRGEKIQMLRSLVLGAALFYWGLQAPVFAIQLNEIEVTSRLGEPFSATIALGGLDPDSADMLQVVQASPAVYQSLAMDYSSYLSTLSFQVQGKRVLVRSNRIACEQVMDLIVDARSPYGRDLRAYVVMLDPPDRPRAQLGQLPGRSQRAGTAVPIGCRSN